MILDAGGMFTGSRAFGTPSDEYESDWDVVIKANLLRHLSHGIREHHLDRWLRRPPVKDLVSIEGGVHSHSNWFDSVKYHRLNVIVLWGKGNWNKWMDAHDHCMEVRPEVKEDRVAIFDHYFENQPLDKRLWREDQTNGRFGKGMRNAKHTVTS